ncbi:hypothetical protein CLU79DRAFT_778530 [Phycomyces nitens]|nr:hypothetical protein CLU79DRAFT_778530 [Phycomyces nitens]
MVIAQQTTHLYAPDTSTLRQRTKPTLTDHDDDFEEAPFESTADISKLVPASTRDRSNSIESSDSSDFLHIDIHPDDPLRQAIETLRTEELPRYESGEINKDRFIDLAQAALEEATVEEDKKGVIQEVVETLLAQTGAPLVAEAISEQLRSQEVIEQLAESHEEEKQRQNSSPVHAPEILKEPETEELSSKKMRDEAAKPAVAAPDKVASEYLWRLFRVLLLASIVGLVYHFMRDF